ncbi:MAG: hypothetical protein ABR592_11760, partial [Nitriliruptorales bacterium]
MNQLSLVISGRYPLGRQAVASALTAQPDITVLAVCGDIRDTLLQVQRLAPEIAVIEDNFPRHEYRRICGVIKEEGLPTKVLIAGEMPDNQLLMAAVEAGAAGYVTGDLGLSGLASALRRVAAGETIVPPTMLGPLLGALVDRREKRNALAQR